MPLAWTLACFGLPLCYALWITFAVDWPSSVFGLLFHLACIILVVVDHCLFWQCLGMKLCMWIRMSLVSLALLSFFSFVFLHNRKKYTIYLYICALIPLLPPPTDFSFDMFHEECMNLVFSQNPHVSFLVCFHTDALKCNCLSRITNSKYTFYL